MELRSVIKIAPVICLFLILLLNSGCGPSLKLVKNNFHDYDGLSAELTKLHTNDPDVVNVQTIGKTYEGRSIFAVRISGTVSLSNTKPALMAIFTEHGDEHDVTDLAAGIIRYFAGRYGRDKRVTDLLNRKELWIVPMMNPDGVEYDLSGKVKPFTWRKNRRPLSDDSYGVDLNRNWGRKRDAPINKELKKDLTNRESPVYAGKEPFSEKETRAIRDFLLSHPNIKIFMDYHSGSAGFLQGGVGFPIPCSEKKDLSPDHRRRYEEIAGKFAEEISYPDDKRPPFIVNKERDVAKTVKKYAPWYIKPFIPKNIPCVPGTSGEWVYGELGIMSIGLEMFRDGGDFFDELPESQNKLIENQIRGFLFLLETVSEDPFKGL